MLINEDKWDNEDEDKGDDKGARFIFLFLWEHCLCKDNLDVVDAQ